MPYGLASLFCAPAPGAYTLQQWRVRNGSKALLATYSGACRLVVAGGAGGRRLATSDGWGAGGCRGAICGGWGAGGSGWAQRDCWLHTRVPAVGRWLGLWLCTGAAVAWGTVGSRRVAAGTVNVGSAPDP